MEVSRHVTPVRSASKGRAALVPTLCVGTHVGTLCVLSAWCGGRDGGGRDAERPDVRSHAERGNERGAGLPPRLFREGIASQTEVFASPLRVALTAVEFRQGLGVPGDGAGRVAGRC